MCVCSMSRFLSFAVLLGAADALANQHGSSWKHHHASAHASAGAFSIGSSAHRHNILWGACSTEQLEQTYSPVHSDRCFQADVIFVRIAKTGSTSLTSVLRRVSARYGINGVEAKTPEGLSEPLLSAFHQERPLLEKQLTDMKLARPRLYVTMLRQPVERRLSGFYYEASLKESVKEAGVLSWLKRFEPDWYYDNLKQYDHQPRDEVFDSYDFVGITERFDESVVLLMNMLELDHYCDVLYVPGKVAGESQQASGEVWLTHIPLAKQPEEVRAYAHSEEFQNIIASDRQFYQQAVARMDSDIAKIGKSEFERQVSAFLKWKERVESRCHKSLEIHGDPASWRKEHCYHGDWGCGYKCFDVVCKTQGH